MLCLTEECAICSVFVCVCTWTPWESKGKPLKPVFFFRFSLLEAMLHDLYPFPSSIAFSSCLLRFHMFASLSHPPLSTLLLQLHPPYDCLQGTEGLCFISQWWFRPRSCSQVQHESLTIASGQNTIETFMSDSFLRLLCCVLLLHQLSRGREDID